MDSAPINNSKPITQKDFLENQVKNILCSFGFIFDPIIKEANNSYQLYRIGEETELSKEIEKSLKDPLGSLYSLHSDINKQLKYVLDIIVKAYLKQHSDLIKYACRTKTPNSDLHYSILLKEDNTDNRSRIFNFFDNYYTEEISVNFPIYFQFIQIESIGKINVLEELKFE